MEVIGALAEHGADLNTPDQHGATPAFVAARNGHVEVINALAEHGADLNTPDYDGFTPAYVAAENGYVEVIRALAEHGADLNTPNQDGVSPVLVAANEGHSDVIKLLYKLGADMKPHFKWSMKDLAEKNDQAEAVQCIDRILAKLTNECECCGRSSKRLKKCSKCEKVRYCSRECQKQDHQKHKHECVSVSTSSC